MEIWRKIPNFEDYWVSSEGRIKSTRYGRERIMKDFQQGRGYRGIRLGVSHRFYIHQLVAAAFLPIKGEGQQLDHINRIRSDNRAENLRWVTPSENMKNLTTYTRSAHTKVRNGKVVFCRAHTVESTNAVRD